MDDDGGLAFVCYSIIMITTTIIFPNMLTRILVQLY